MTSFQMSACPNCRKPLPRCAICLMHMGTTTGLSSTNENDNRLAEFSNWFTWCQTCRHGGHASHMIHWFKYEKSRNLFLMSNDVILGNTQSVR